MIRVFLGAMDLRVQLQKGDSHAHKSSTVHGNAIFFTLERNIYS